MHFSLASWLRWVWRQHQRSNRPAPSRLIPPSCRPQFDCLEERLAPATRIWTGAAGDALWTDKLNWQGKVAPIAGDTLVFGAAAHKASVKYVSLPEMFAMLAA